MCCRCCPSLWDTLLFVCAFALLVSMGKLTFWTPWMLDSHMPHASSNARFGVMLPTKPRERIALSSDYIYLPSWYAAKTFHMAVALHIKRPCAFSTVDGGASILTMLYLRTCGCEAQLRCVDAQQETLAYIRLGAVQAQEEFFYRSHVPTLRPNPSHSEMDASRPRCLLELHVTRPCNVTAEEVGPVFVYWHADVVPDWTASDWISRTLYSAFYPFPQ